MLTPPDASTAAPGVTVIIATRHRPELLARAVEAVLQQRYTGPIDVIAVFDQTEPLEYLSQDDGTGRRVFVCTNVNQPGLPGARNTGIGMATQPLLAFCDDDDLWLPDKLARQVGAMHALSLPVAVAGIQIRYGDEVRVRTIDSSRLTYAHLLRDRVTAAHPSSYLADRAFVLDEVGMVDEDIPGGYGEDYDWLLRVAKKSDIAVVPEPQVEVLWHPGSFFTRRWEVIVDALEYLLDKHPDLAADRQGAARIHAQQAFALAAVGKRREGWRKTIAAAKGNPRERRLLVTLPVLCGVVGADRVLHIANKFGRGI